jgi:cardiolipin synthase
MKANKPLLHKVPPYALTWSTFFTLIRIALIPFIVSSLYAYQWFSALILFGFAALTDVLDGALARFLQESTLLGAYLDPIADKLLVIASFGTFSELNLVQFQVPSWFLLLMYLKELFLLLGALCCLKYNPTLIRPSIWGKLTMTVQSASIGFLLMGLLMNNSYIWWSHSLIIFITLLMMIALLHYAYQMVLGLLWIKN